GLDRRKRDGDVLLKGMSALRAETRVVSIGMSTVGAEHREPFVAPGSSWRSRDAANPRPSMSGRSYRTAHRGSTWPPGQHEPRGVLTLERGWMRLRVASVRLVYERAVLGGAHQAVQAAPVGALDDDQPTVAVGLVVDQLRAVVDERAPFRDRARDRAEDVGDGLRRLHLSERRRRLD